MEDAIAGSPHVQVKPDQYQSGKPVSYIDTTRKRVLLVQMYFKKIQLGIFLKFKNGDVKEITAEQLDDGSVACVAVRTSSGSANFPSRRYGPSIFSGDVLLEEEKPTVYQHNRFPLIPFICYMDEDGNPYGMIRNMKDPQREINKNRSQYSHIITTRRVFFETGAFKNPLEAKKEISRPDAWIELNHGRLESEEIPILAGRCRGPGALRDHAGGEAGATGGFRRG